MAQQTAVEWLYKIYLQTKKIDSFDIEQAKQMERKEISDQEIEEGSRDYIKGTDLDRIVERTFFKAGAKWVINHIKQQDK